MEARFIRVVGARQHNLQDVHVDIPRDRLVVLTGLSGSGKSSLAFDTIYAEGQRKYVESLSVHARLFLEQVGKPDVERIEGLPPTLAIEQRAAAANPRSTVATTTEIYDFLRLLFARVGRPHCPACGVPLYRRTVDQIVDQVLAYPGDARVMVLAPLARGLRGDARPVLRRIQREGFVRARINGNLMEVAEIGDLPGGRGVDIDVVVDRLVLRPDVRHRLADAVELSLSLGDGTVIVSRARDGGAVARERATSEAGVRDAGTGLPPAGSNDGAGAPGSAMSGGGSQPPGDGDRTTRAAAARRPAGTGNGGDPWTDETFSERFACARCGFTLAEISPRLFSFNSPYGACQICGGLGAVQRFDPELIVPDDGAPMLSAVVPWSAAGKRAAAHYAKIARALCEPFGVKPQTPFRNLPDDLRRIVLFGSRPKDKQQYGVEFEGVIPNLQRRSKAAGPGGQARFAAYQTETVCESCRGARLKPEALAVKVAGLSIHEITRMSIEQAVDFFEHWQPAGEEGQVAAPILHEVRQRLRFMHEVGLDYLTLDRGSATLSGGEAQRIRLATQLGSGLVGVCYVLDEPTIGLHQRDNERLLGSIRRLVDIGNTVIVVEHDEDVIRAADYLIDMGPGAGLHGGRIIAHGPVEQVLAHPASITGKYLRGEYRIQLRERVRTPKRSDMLQIIGARQNNLRSIDVSIPLGVFCAVTGVSGSGKSTLISQTLLPALRRRLHGSRERPGEHERLVGAHKVDRVIEVDQTPIGRTPRSNPATYTGVFDEIRRLYARTKEARIRGYDHSRFSFNARGGRCEACQGQGVRRIEMHFLPDVFVECGECRGTRYNRETLEVRYRGKSIADVLEMRVEEALPLFDSFSRIRAGLAALSDVGLGYLRLGQPSNTLSGGEAQRVKLAAELCKPATGHTLYVLDEPTTGLHLADIDTLLAVLNRLVDMGHTVLVIEHNLDVIKNADWIIDLGPEGGDQGGRVVVAGPPAAVAACPASHTGRYLRAKLMATAS